jgi:hypothetical protein
MTNLPAGIPSKLLPQQQVLSPEGRWSAAFSFAPPINVMGPEAGQRLLFSTPDIRQREW